MRLLRLLRILGVSLRYGLHEIVLEATGRHRFVPPVLRRRYWWTGYIVT